MKNKTTNPSIEGFVKIRKLSGAGKALEAYA
jgi:hypothetical protein